MFKLISFVLITLTISAQIWAQCGGYFKEQSRQVLSNGIVFSYFDDFDNDGKEDLLGFKPTSYVFVWGYMDFQFYYYKRLGANSFDTAAKSTAIPNGNLYNGFVVGDVNGDGFKDLVFRHMPFPGTIVTYLNDGDGRFTTALPSTVNGDQPMTMSDLNGDGKADLISTNSSSGLIYRLTQPDNSFGSAVTLAANVNISRGENLGESYYNPVYPVLAEDLNGDGLKDVAYISMGTLKVLTNTGNLAFTETASFPFPRSLGKLKAYDLNNDGKKDFVSDYTYPAAMASVNNGNNTFSNSALNLIDTNATRYGASEASRNTVVADFDNDGDADIIFHGLGAYTLFRNQGNATFVREIVAAYAGIDSVANLDGDGRADGVFMNYSFIDGSYTVTDGDGSNNWIFYLRKSVSFRKNVCNKRGQTKIIDFNGDGTVDRAFWNPSTGYFRYYNNDGTLQTAQTYYQFGSGSFGDVPAPNDYDGDGTTDYAIYRKSNGTWWIAGSSGQSNFGFNFGTTEDKPIPADYDGDGKADIAVYRPSNGTWHFWLSETQQYRAVQFGIAEDKPVPADYDGDGKADIAVFRPSTGVWYVLKSSDGSYSAIQYGLGTDIPVPGDYDGDGKANITVFRDGIWYVLKSDFSTAGIFFGTAGDKPFFNDTLIRPTVGVYRSSNSTYHLAYTGSTYSSAQPTGNSSGEIFVSSILPQP